MERLPKLTERTQVSVYTSVPQISSRDYNYLHSQDTKIQLEIQNEHCSTNNDPKCIFNIGFGKY